MHVGIQCRSSSIYVVYERLMTSLPFSPGLYLPLLAAPTCSQILLLDEATSALDTQSERLVQVRQAAQVHPSAHTASMVDMHISS
jgi:hypothetical protein